MARSELQQALEAGQYGLQIADSFQNPDLQACFCLSIGTTLSHIGSQPLALETLRKIPAIINIEDRSSMLSIGGFEMEIRKFLLLLFWVYVQVGLDHDLLCGQRESALNMTKRGNLLLDAGRIDEAVQLYTDALISDHKWVIVYAQRGIARHKKGELDLAIGDFREVVRLDQRMAAAHYNQGRLLMKQHDLEAAHAALQRAIEIEPDVPGAYMCRALVHLLMMQDDEANKGFRRCLSLQPSLRSIVDAEIKRVLERRAEEAPHSNPPVTAILPVS